MAMPVLRAETHGAVLLIESDDGVRAKLAEILSREGYDVTEATSGAVALAAVGSRPFELIVTQPKLPGFAGALAVTALRELGREVPIVVFATKPSVEEAVLAMKHGAAEYLTPEGAANLPAVACRAVERRGGPAVVPVDPAAVFVDAAHRADVAARALDLWVNGVRADAHVLTLCGPNGTELFMCGEARRMTSPIVRERMSGLGELLAPAEPFSPIELRDLGLSGALVVPLRARRTFVGNALAMRRAGGSFPAAEISRVAELGERLAAGLHPVLRARELDERVRELELTRNQTVQTEKLALARKLVGGVAHEINNPLAFVRANLEALRDYTQAAVRLVRGERTHPEMSIDEVVTEIEAILSESQEGLRRIGDLIANFQLLSTSHMAARHEDIELTALVDGCIATVTATSATDSKRSRRFLRETQERLTARAGKSDLLTGLGHVLSWLRDPARVGATAEDAEPVRLRIAADGGRPCVFVFDSLLEIPAAERASLFDPRLTVEEARGQRRIRLDLELALAHQLLVRAGGSVSLQPGPNSGLIFRVRFV